MLRNDKPMADILQSETTSFAQAPEPEADPGVTAFRRDADTGAEAPYPQTERRHITEAENGGAAGQRDRRQGERREGERRQGERRTGERRGMGALREDVQWTVAPDRRGRSLGLGEKRVFGMKISRVVLLAVALLAGGLAAVLATQRDRPATQPSTEVAVQSAPAPPPVPTTKVLVAKNAIGVGQRVTDASLGWEAWPEKSMRSDYITEAARPDAVTEMKGKVARSEILAGEPIRTAKLVTAKGGFLSAVLDKGQRAVSVAVASDSASGGFVSPRDHVDVVLTRRAAGGEVSGAALHSETILRNVRVLAINTNLGRGTSGGSKSSDKLQPEAFAGKATATLALDPTQARVIINAAAIGQLSLVLRSVGDFAGGSDSGDQSANQAIRISSPFWTN